MKHSLLLLIAARLREFYREPGVLFWVFGFPLLLAVSLGIAFRDRPQPVYKIGICDCVKQYEKLMVDLEKEPHLDVRLFSETDLQKALAAGQVVLGVQGTVDKVEWVFDPDRQETAFVRLLAEQAVQKGAGRQDVLLNTDTYIKEPGSRYIDFLIPGLLALNIMSSSLWGIGWAIVQSRSRKELKRLAATPMKKSHYMAAQWLSRLVLMVCEVFALLLLGIFLFGVPLRGSWIDLFIICMAGTVCFSGIACLLASRTERTEVVSGLMNLVMLPMYVLCGVFFARNQFPDAVQPILDWLPLSMILDGLRGVMLEGRSWWPFWPQVLVLVLCGVLTSALAIRWFRWK